MTVEEKIKIKELRQQGISYANIAHELGISINTIKTFCLRNGMAKVQKGVQRCLVCGKGLPKTKYKPRKFCSDSCRNLWWNKRRYLRRSDQIAEITCIECGENFFDYRSKRRKYCSQACFHSHRNLLPPEINIKGDNI